MDGWMDGWMDGLDGCMDGWMDGWKKGRMDGWEGRWGERVAAVAARAKTEAKEIERRRIEKAMGAAQSDLVAEPFRALFTGGSTETVGGRPLF